MKASSGARAAAAAMIVLVLAVAGVPAMPDGTGQANANMGDADRATAWAPSPARADGDLGMGASDGLPADGPDRTADRQANRAWLLEQLGPDFDPAAQGTVGTPDGPVPATGQDLLDRVLDRADAVGIDLSVLDRDAPAAHGGFPNGGTFFVLFEFVLGPAGSVACSQGGGGFGGHYDAGVLTGTFASAGAAVSQPTPAGDAFASAVVTVWPYQGYATSDLSVNGQGFFLRSSPAAWTSQTGELVPDQALTYSTDLTYGGSSDFWCTQFVTETGTAIVSNFPFVDGVVYEP